MKRMIQDAKRVLRVSAQRIGSLFREPGQQLSPSTIVAEAKGPIDQFHALWYASNASQTLKWLGQPILKNPMDLWIYQEILYSARPDIIVETGTHLGGSALFFAQMGALAGLDLDVITVDFNPKLNYDPARHRIHPVAGISTTSATLDKVRGLIARRADERRPKIMVVLDSDHTKKNVLDELAAYAPFVTEGQYLVVEDTNVNGHPVLPEFGPGGYEAVQEFLASHPEFESDGSCERMLLTMHPKGWLKRRG